MMSSEEVIKPMLRSVVGFTAHSIARYEGAGLVKKRRTKAKQLPKCLLWRRGLPRRRAPRTASLVVAGWLGLVGGRIPGQIRLGRGFGHAGESDCPRRELYLVLTWARWTSLLGRARRWMGLRWMATVASQDPAIDADRRRPHWVHTMERHCVQVLEFGLSSPLPIRSVVLQTGHSLLLGMGAICGTE
ncbi:hypothetical protein EYF80_005315 [Liparis tanakae]|uniref:Uncharacterized protein n=1 Tax=Liparis tanakae TaxID=230148 RepID=A0A4Z2J4D3_9TELE|nr:hypothetical protein EYF80_005315 [Liparis tanakae]